MAQISYVLNVLIYLPQCMYIMLYAEPVCKLCFECLILYVDRSFMYKLECINLSECFLLAYILTAISLFLCTAKKPVQEVCSSL
jgi:hypothetical protein